MKGIRRACRFLAEYEAMHKEEKQTWWGTFGPVIAALFALAFYGGLFLWLDIQESGGFAAMFQDQDKMLAKALMVLERLARLL